MKKKKEKKISRFEEKIKKTFRKIALVGIIFASALTSSYSIPMRYAKYPSSAFLEYKYEFSFIEKGREEKSAEKGYMYFKKARDLIEAKQKNLGEGKDVKLDFLRVYSIFLTAKSLPEPELAEKYLLEAKELAEKYYKIWKEDAFLDIQASALENLGYGYFDTAESIRRGKICFLLLEKPILGVDGPLCSMIVREEDLYYCLRNYPVVKIINSKNFTEILYYYEIAKKWYEEYLKFCEEYKLEEIIRKKYPDALVDYMKGKEEVLSHLKIIDKILSKYKPDYKKEEKEAVEKKEEIEKEEKKTKEKEQEKINWEEIKDKDIQDGL